MSNPVIFLCFNRTPEQLELSKDALASILAQDIPVDVFAIDNGSTEETWEWMESVAETHSNFACYRNMENVSPVKVSNEWMGEIFGRLGYKHVLGVPNDVILRSDTYSQFLKWPRGIVTGSMVPDRSYDINAPLDVAATSECTPMAVVLTRSWVHDALISKDGYFFDPRFALYCSDCDFALRIASCGIRGIQLNLPYWHYGSASHRLSTPEIGDAIRRGADADRRRFFDRWGFKVDDYEYGAMAQDINFKGGGNG